MAGPIVAGSSGVASGTAFSAYWRALGKRLGPFRTLSADATATGFEAEAVVRCGRLADDDEGADRFKRAYLYVTTGDQAGVQKRLRSDGFEPSAGALKLASPFDAVLASGSEFDMSRPLPVDIYGDCPTLKEVVVAALGRLPLHHDVDFTYAQNQVRYGLDSLPWTLKREHVLDVFRPIPTGYTAAETRPSPLNRGSWGVEYDGDAPYLVLWTGFNDGDTFSVKFQRPARSWVSVGGAWGDSTTGPTNDDDECLYDEETVANVGLEIAYERLEVYALEMGDEKLAAMCAGKRRDAAVAAVGARLYGRFRGTGRQRVGAVGRTWV